MYKTGDSCSICAEGKLSEQIITEEFEYKSKKIRISNYHIYRCDECKEELVSPKTIRETEKILTDFRRGIDGLLTSDEIKSIRKKIGKTQKDLATLLEVGEKTFARYENGQVTQSKAMDILLRLMGNFPDILNQIGKEVKFDYEVKAPPIPCCAGNYPEIKYKLGAVEPRSIELGVAA